MPRKCKSDMNAEAPVKQRNGSGKPPKDASGPGSTTQAPRLASKTARLLQLLAQPEGATIAELCEATGWQQHSVRGAIAGTLKKRGHVVTSDKVGGLRRYRLGTAA